MSEWVLASSDGNNHFQLLIYIYIYIIYVHWFLYIMFMVLCQNVCISNLQFIRLIG
jgi:hypothetical protein